MIRITLAFLIPALAAFPSTARSEPWKPPIRPQHARPRQQRFALDLYGRLGRGEGNRFFSPFSISTALAMTYAGAQERDRASRWPRPCISTCRPPSSTPRSIA